DSLEWTLGAQYNHEKDVFTEKSSTLRRPGRDRRWCYEEVEQKKGYQVEVAQRKGWLEVREVPLEAGQWVEHNTENKAGNNSPPVPGGRTKQPSQHNNGTDVDMSKVDMGGGPRVVRARTQDSLTSSLLYTPRPTHTLTVPKASSGYARNPNGAFFTS
ncbi:hypothetical protein OTU49_000090, partial [Cherax quadricarinatus]